MKPSSRKKPPISKPKPKRPRPVDHEAEYRLLITPHASDRGGEPTTLLVLETTKSFATYRYELSVEERVGERSLYFKIRGLKAPQLSLPSSGHAEFVREYEGLKGTFEVSIEGLDGAVNSFTVRIGPAKVQILKSPGQRTVELITERSLWYRTNDDHARP